MTEQNRVEENNFLKINETNSWFFEKVNNPDEP